MVSAGSNFRGIHLLIWNGNFCSFHVKPGLTGYFSKLSISTLQISTNLQKHICWFHPPQAHCRMAGCGHEAGCLRPSAGSKHHSSHIDCPSHRSHNDSHTWMGGVWQLCCSRMSTQQHMKTPNTEWSYLCFRTPCLSWIQTCLLLCRGGFHFWHGLAVQKVKYASDWSIDSTAGTWINTAMAL